MLTLLYFVYLRNEGSYQYKEMIMSTMTLEKPLSTALRKINAPKNRILARLKEQAVCGEAKDNTVAYSRMHNRHNRG